MASLPVPPGGMGGPEQGPPPAPGMPTLANIPPSAPPQMGDPMSQGGALPRLVFQIEEQIGTLARALPPDMSAKLDAIKQSLREVVAEALSGGGEQSSSPTGPY